MRDALQRSAAIVLLGALSGCSYLPWSGDSGDTASGPRELTLPPDLELEEGPAALTVPAEAGPREVSAERGELQGEVLPQPRDVEVKRNGGERWLVVDDSPAAVYRLVGEFLDAQGVAVSRRKPQVGIIETEWLFTEEPLGRGAFATSMPGPEGAPAADRYLIRVEPGARAGTEVFVAHRRVTRQGPQRWRLRDSDPFFQAEFLRTLLVYLGGELDESFRRVASATDTASASVLQRDANGAPVLILEEGFADAWRQVGLALDRASFSVDDRDRSAGDYRIRYDRAADRPRAEEGFLSGLLFWQEDAPETVATYRLSVNARDGETRVAVQTVAGEPAAEDQAGEILAVLREQLR